MLRRSDALLEAVNTTKALPKFKQSAHLFVVQRERFSFVCFQDVLNALLVAKGDESEPPAFGACMNTCTHSARATLQVHALSN